MPTGEQFEMVTDQLAQIVRQAVDSARDSGDLSVGLDAVVSQEIDFHLPKNKQFGDYATNLAMTVAKAAGLPPREVAARIVKHIAQGNGLIDRVEIAGPGFLNFYLKLPWLQ